MPILDATAALAAAAEARAVAAARASGTATEATSGAGRLVVVSLCAAWCHTCGEFRAALEGVAASRPDVTFVWLDIEDDAELCGDVEVDNFPTLAAFRGREVLHHGVSLPHAGIVGRLVDELAMRERGLADPDEALLELRDRLV